MKEWREGLVKPSASLQFLRQIHWLAFKDQSSSEAESEVTFVCYPDECWGFVPMAGQECLVWLACLAGDGPLSLFLEAQPLLLPKLLIL